MYEEASQIANDAVRSIRTIASFCAEEKVMALYRKKCEGPVRTGIREGLISGFGFGLSFFLLYSVYAASFYAGAQLVEAGNTTFVEVFRVKSFWVHVCEFRHQKISFQTVPDLAHMV